MNQNSNLESTLKRIEDKIDRIEERLDKLDKHINFIDDVYEDLKNPLSVAKKFFGRKWFGQFASIRKIYYPHPPKIYNKINDLK